MYFKPWISKYFNFKIWKFRLYLYTGHSFSWKLCHYVKYGFCPFSTISCFFLTSQRSSNSRSWSSRSSWPFQCIQLFHVKCSYMFRIQMQEFITYDNNITCHPCDKMFVLLPISMIMCRNWGLWVNFHDFPRFRGNIASNMNGVLDEFEFFF